MADAPLTLFLCGDVMTGRGVDQILPHPSDPALQEPFVADAREYVYEGISGYEHYRDDLVLMFFPSVKPSQRLAFAGPD